ncbi:Bax inhibitor-1/YccA family protein [Nocardioides sp. AE5]|uniref:Bax inhibitor-1/YccA family protein n=1 Tax=Nocardioides sp. AE5 TaxID=2962573 RepID=UPI0028828EEA|nr:Bax inhibitor-1/YccA family protein [Nocardioides sp. AE5]MDT0202284.1 Bax inhibitor-1/YccA family protein [Nocardioides sp. AE5]
MQSNNPIFNRSPQFNGQGGQQTYADPSQWDISQPGQAMGYAPTTERMTIDSVVQRTAMSIGVVIAVAMATWILTPDVSTATTQADLSPLMAAVTIGALGAFALSMVNSFKRVVSPALVLAFAALEGVALGGLSKLFNSFYEGNIVMGAVIGTFAAFAGTLAAYKFFNIKVSGKFRMFVTAAVFGMIGLAVMELVLGLFSAQIGLFGVSGLGMVTAFGGLILGVFMLILDFDFVERGVAAGLEERESWRAAFAMTVSLVWIYTNLLRILAFFSQD